MTLAEIVSLAKDRLSTIYSKDEANAIVMQLCEHYFGLSRTDFYLKKDVELNDINSFLQTLGKIEQHCPIQYAIGEASFYGLTFKLNEHVLIPRPETEELVDWIIKDHNAGKPLNILDIGTGSGAIAVSLAKSIPSAHLTAIDISPSVLDIAKNNASLNNALVSFLEDNIFAPSSSIKSQLFDVIVSNPPYVRESEKKYMHPNVLKYEPALALFVPDSNPLKYYQAIADYASEHLAKNGSIYLEINEELGNETAALFPKDVYSINLRKDLSGKIRMLKLTTL